MGFAASSVCIAKKESTSGKSFGYLLLLLQLSLYLLLS